VLVTRSTEVFDLGDIIKHKRSDTYYLIVDIKRFLSGNLERLEYIAVDMGNGVEVYIHYPLMTVNYEKVV